MDIEEETNKKSIISIMNEIAKYEFDVIEATINRLFSQSSCEFIEPSHSDYMCKLYEPDTNPELYIDYKEKYNPKLYNGVIQCVYNNTLMMKMFSIYTMEEYIQLNNSNRYVFIPILLSSPYGSGNGNGNGSIEKNKSNSINMTCLIIDNYTLNVYFLDSCGWTNFFDTQVKSDTIQEIEKIFFKYFDDLNIGTGLAYNFISVKEWNPKNLNLLSNILKSNSFISVNDTSSLNGIICLMFCHYLNDCKSNTVEEAFDCFIKVDDDEKIQIYIGYTMMFYQELLTTSIELGVDLNDLSNLNVEKKINTEPIEEQDDMTNYDKFIIHETDNFISKEQEKYITIRPKKKKVDIELDEFEKELF